MSRYYSPPPPSTPRDGLVAATWNALEESYQTISLTYGKEVILLVLTVAVIKFSGDSRDDSQQAAISVLIRLGLVVYSATATSLHLERRSVERQPVKQQSVERQSAFRPASTPLVNGVHIVTGFVTELALAVLPGHDRSQATQDFLVGAVYAKLLVVGALCLLSSGQHSEVRGSGITTTRLRNVCVLLATGGAFVLALPSHIESKRRQRRRKQNADRECRRRPMGVARSASVPRS